MQVNPDLQRERQRGTFDPEELTYIIYGGRDKTLRRRFLENIIVNDPAFTGPKVVFLSRQDAFIELLQKQVNLVKKLHGLGIFDEKEAAIMNNILPFNGIGPFMLHGLAFLPSIRMMADQEQRKKWIPLAENFEIVGCYAQTELAHGSFLNGLETRADFDVNTKQFILNTPELTSTKWWVGCLGVCATHALVMAQLYIKDKCYGVHPFMVQLRDIKTHNTLPGITVGDIGPKMGFTGVDNGFLRLHNVPVPRDHLLGKTGKVLEDGTYVKPQNLKLVYGSMLSIRAHLPKLGAVSIAKAVTIAIRYSCIRHQSELKSGCGEPQVLDYQTQQHKLFPLLAAAYAFHFVGQWMIDLHEGVMAELNHGNDKRLPEDHVLSAGLKAVVNWKVHEGVEACRIACGGHGYSLASGLPTLYVDQVASSTAEGETTILLLQTAMYLMKCLLDLQQQVTLDPSVTYLNQTYLGSMHFSGDIEISALLKVMQFRSKKCIEYVGGFVQNDLVHTGSKRAALNKNKVNLIECAKAHTEAVIMQVFVTRVEECLLSNLQIGHMMEILCQIYGITEVLAHAGDYIQYGCLNKGDVDHLNDQLFKSYANIRPQAVLLVDAFDFHDQVLNSILGRYDGQVYDNMYKWAKDSPLNKQNSEVYWKYIQLMKQAKL